MRDEDQRPSIAGDLVVIAVAVCGLAFLYFLQFWAGYLGSIGLWFCGVVFYYCLCPVLLVLLLFTRKEHAIRIVAVFILLMASVFAFLVPAYHPFTSGFLRRMKSEVDPHQLQTWALDLIKTRRAEVSAIAQGHTEHLKAVRDTPPEFIRKVTGYENPHVAVGTRDGQWNVLLLYGGGLKGWGLFVGDTNLDLRTDDTDYFVQWQPGIIAVHGR
ncbi:MAG TPA: hypothetical protein VMV72_00460 [Verrucomicrobiae bacterium]|nr:hypothetical protein [Verrucomicrobiae bacterium]